MGDLRLIVADAADAAHQQASAVLSDIDNDEPGVDPEWAAVMAGAAAALRAMAHSQPMDCCDPRSFADRLRAAADELEATP